MEGNFSEISDTQVCQKILNLCVFIMA